MTSDLPIRTLHVCDVITKESVPLDIDPGKSTFLVFSNEWETLGKALELQKEETGAQFVGIYTGTELAEKEIGDKRENGRFWTGPEGGESSVCKVFGAGEGITWVGLHRGRTVYQGKVPPKDIPSFLASLESEKGPVPMVPEVASVRINESLWNLFKIDGSGSIEIRPNPLQFSIFLFSSSSFILQEFISQLQVLAPVPDLEIKAFMVFTGPDLKEENEHFGLDTRQVEWIWTGTEGLESKICLDFEVRETPAFRCFFQGKETYRGATLPDPISILYTDLEKPMTEPPENDSKSSKIEYMKSEETEESKSEEIEEGKSVADEEGLERLDNIKVYKGLECTETDLEVDRNDFLLLMFLNEDRICLLKSAEIYKQMEIYPILKLIPIYIPANFPDFLRENESFYPGLLWIGSPGFSSVLCSVLKVTQAPFYVLLNMGEVRYRSAESPVPFNTTLPFLQPVQISAVSEGIVESKIDEIDIEGGTPATYRLSLWPLGQSEAVSYSIPDDQYTLILFFNETDQLSAFKTQFPALQKSSQIALFPLAIYTGNESPSDLITEDQWVYWSGQDGFDSNACEVFNVKSAPFFEAVYQGRRMWSDEELPEDMRELFEGVDLLIQEPADIVSLQEQDAPSNGSFTTHRTLEDALHLPTTNRTVEVIPSNRASEQDLEMYRKRILQLEEQLSASAKTVQNLQSAIDTLMTSAPQTKSMEEKQTQTDFSQEPVLGVEPSPNLIHISEIQKTSKNRLNSQMSEPLISADLDFWDYGQRMKELKPAPRKLEDIASSKGLWIVSAENLAALNPSRDIGLSFLQSMKKTSAHKPRTLSPLKNLKQRQVSASSQLLGKTNPEKLTPIGLKEGKITRMRKGTGSIALAGKRT